MPKLIIKNKNINLEVEKGISVLEACLENRVQLYHTCGGNASCSTCRVRILKGEEYLSKIEAAEAAILDAFDLKPPHRLGCQTLILNDSVELEIPKWIKPPRPNKTPPISEGRHGTY